MSASAQPSRAPWPRPSLLHWAARPLQASDSSDVSSLEQLLCCCLSSPEPLSSVPRALSASGSGLFPEPSESATYRVSSIQVHRVASWFPQNHSCNPAIILFQSALFLSLPAGRTEEKTGLLSWPNTCCSMVAFITKVKKPSTLSSSPLPSKSASLSAYRKASLIPSSP